MCLQAVWIREQPGGRSDRDKERGWLDHGNHAGENGLEGASWWLSGKSHLQMQQTQVLTQDHVQLSPCANNGARL